MTDSDVRLAAFAFLEQQVGIRGEVLPWSTLLEGFTHQGTRVPLIGPQGIFFTPPPTAAPSATPTPSRTATRWSSRTVTSPASSISRRRSGRTLGVARGIYMNLPDDVPLWLRSDQFVPLDPERLALILR